MVPQPTIIEESRTYTLARIESRNSKSLVVNVSVSSSFGASIDLHLGNGCALLTANQAEKIAAALQQAAQMLRNTEAAAANTICVSIPKSEG